MFWRQTDQRTNERTDALWRCRYREQRLNKHQFLSILITSVFVLDVESQVQVLLLHQCFSDVKLKLRCRFGKIYNVLSPCPVYRLHTLHNTLHLRMNQRRCTHKRRNNNHLLHRCNRQLRTTHLQDLLSSSLSNWSSLRDLR